MHFFPFLGQIWRLLVVGVDSTLDEKERGDERKDDDDDDDDARLLSFIRSRICSRPEGKEWHV